MEAQKADPSLTMRIAAVLKNEINASQVVYYWEEWCPHAQVGSFS